MNITKERFLVQCKPRFGAINPERMRMEVWEHLVRSGEDVYFLRKKFSLETTCEESCANGKPKPDWCFKRFGMSKTPMPDGRIVCIGGEHEDWYDPNFCIYNDVVVVRPAPGEAWVTETTGEVAVYGYPRVSFPPTDFHSATLVGEHILVIGRLGYPEDRNPPTTPVFSLDTKSYEMRSVQTSGSSPGLLFGHHAEYEAATNCVVVRGGTKYVADGDPWNPENHSVFRLHLADGRWEQIREHEPFQRFLIDNEPQSTWCELTLADFLPKHVPHRLLLAEDRGYWTFELSVCGVRVRFEDSSPIRMFVEGELPPEVLEQLLADIRENLAASTNQRWTASEVSTFG